MTTKTRRVIVVGASWGGVEANIRLLKTIPAGFPLPVVIVQHRHSDSHGALATSLRRYCALPVNEIEDKDEMIPGRVYIAPANYHLLMEPDFSFSLCVSAYVNYSRPSIDVAMESIAEVCGEGTIGVLLTWANDDGAKGMAAIHAAGGMTIAQDPDTAAAPTMPRSAIELGVVDKIMKIDAIVPCIREFLD